MYKSNGGLLFIPHDEISCFIFIHLVTFLSILPTPFRVFISRQIRITCMSEKKKPTACLHYLDCKELHVQICWRKTFQEFGRTCIHDHLYLANHSSERPKANTFLYLFSIQLMLDLYKIQSIYR